MVPEEEADSQPVPLTWVFKYKGDDEGRLSKFKARLCARGDLQNTDLETYAATLSAKIFRTMMAMIAQQDLETIQLDAVNAFLNAKLPHPIYLYLPDGWRYRPESKGKLLKCEKALYGFKISPRLWYNHLKEQLNLMKAEEVDQCIFRTPTGILIFFFVDDIALAYPTQVEKEALDLKQQLMSKYEMRDLGEIDWFCGIKITRDRRNKQLWINQEAYMEKLIKRYDLKPALKVVKSPLPMDFSTGNDGKATAEQINVYGSKVGSINFAATQTRPDIAFATSKLSQCLKNPSDKHITAADHTLKYLFQTKDIGIKYGNQEDMKDFFGASDASFSDDPETRRSSEGYVFFLYGGAIDWKATRQTAVTKSSTEAELYSISHAGSEMIWWNRLMQKLDLRLRHQDVLYCDNRQTLRILTSDSYRLHTKMRHVDVQQCWLKEQVLKGHVRVDWIGTNQIHADGFTKLLAPNRHIQFVEQLRLSHVTI